MDSNLLDNIQSPDDIKEFNSAQLNTLCGEIRQFLVNSVSKTGGHLSSNLGVVELSVAIHHKFNSPTDKIIFDVGHQSYTHKIITGRKNDFHTLRKQDGISGFMKPKESIHDPFITGHSSNSISAAYGIATGFKLNQVDAYTIAVIGDGALTGGLVYEALNNAGRSKTKLIIIINHNDMSISKNVGQFARYLAKVRSKPSYLSAKRVTKGVLAHTPLVGKYIRRAVENFKSRLKNNLYDNNFFEDMGFDYFGPIDGHNIDDLLLVLENAKQLNSPVVIHIETKKGKGYELAELSPSSYHATGVFDPVIGVSTAYKDNFSNQAGKFLSIKADSNNKICAITAAMGDGTGLQFFQSKFKDRFFDVGIAEAHAVTFSAGLASIGLIPVFAVYSSFLQRAYDQIIHDVTIDNNHVVLLVDRAGIVGEDGETHQGIYDVSFLSHMPNCTILSPDSYRELQLCIDHAVDVATGLVVVRYPRGTENVSHELPPTLSYGTINNNSDSVVISYGRIFDNCLKAVQKKENSHDLIKLTKISPLPTGLISKLLSYKRIVFVEEGVKFGGVGSVIATELIENGYNGSFKLLAIEGLVPHSNVQQAMEFCKISTKDIFEVL